MDSMRIFCRDILLNSSKNISFLSTYGKIKNNYGLKKDSGRNTNQNMELDQIRKQINAVDDAMHRYFTDRLRCSEDVAEAKLQTQDSVYKPERESRCTHVSPVMQMRKNCTVCMCGRLCNYRGIISMESSLEKEMWIRNLRRSIDQFRQR